jgi:hypothetical protein
MMGLLMAKHGIRRSDEAFKDKAYLILIHCCILLEDSPLLMTYTFSPLLEVYLIRLGVLFVITGHDLGLAISARVHG